MPTTLAPPLAAESTRPHRLGCPARLRAVAHLPALEPGRYLAVHADGEVVVVPLTASPCSSTTAA